MAGSQFRIAEAVGVLGQNDPSDESGQNSKGLGASLRFSKQALFAWGPRQWIFAALASLGIGLLIGIATVLIPNPWFGRDIAPVWWNYPVWIATSIISGMVLTTYIRPSSDTAQLPKAADSEENGVGAATTSDGAQAADKEESRSARFGMVGSFLAWFAVGCPVCNKIALLALGYSGAITWFAPVQPFLGVAALILTGVALIWRLRGQIMCPVPVGAKLRVSDQRVAR